MAGGGPHAGLGQDSQKNSKAILKKQTIVKVTGGCRVKDHTFALFNLDPSLTNSKHIIVKSTNFTGVIKNSSAPYLGGTATMHMSACQ